MARLALAFAIGCVALLNAASAGAATKIYSLYTGTISDVSGIGPSNSGASFVFFGDCRVSRVIPSAGDNGGTPSVVAGQQCGAGTHTVQATQTSATGVSLGPSSLVAGTAGDDGVLIADIDKGIVDKFSGNQLQTIAGTGTCGSPPADNSPSASAPLCFTEALAADPSTTGTFAIFSGDVAPASKHVYVVSGTSRANSTIRTVAGGCQPAPAVAALQLCFLGIGGLAFADSSTLLVASGGTLYKVALGDGSVQQLLQDPDLNRVVAGFASDAYFTSGCLVKRLSALDGTGVVTTVGGNGDCSAASRPDGDLATNSSMNPSHIASYAGGLLIADIAAPATLRLIDRASILTHPDRYTTTPGSITYATLSGVLAQCEVGSTLGGAATMDNCANPFPLFASDDDYVFGVNENIGTTDPTREYWRWTVDTKPPTTPSLDTPSDATHVDTAQPLLKWIAADDPGPTDGFATIPGSGVDHYELLIDNQKDSNASCCETRPAKLLGEGTHKWSVRAVDRAGNVSAASAERSLSYGSAPTAQLSLAPNPALTGATVKLDGAGSSDAEGPIARYEWDLDGDGTYERDTGASSSTTTTFASAGTYTLGLRVTDAVGNTATTSAQLRVTAPPTPASLFGVTINNGAQYTRDPNVTISVKFPSLVTGILLSNDGGFLAPATFAPQSQISWRLDSSGPERLPKIVYARFFTGPVISETYTDDIILDETPPVVQQARLAPSATTAANAARLRTFVLKVKATDTNSGVDAVQVAASKARPGPALKYKSTLRLRAATRPKFIRARDRAGNLSAWKTIR